MSENGSPTPPAAVVGRFAPTPSGRIHLGNIFSMLLAWMSARAAGGRVLMRIEDLDPRANSPERAQQLLEDARWLGLYWDGEVVYQHERIERYEEALRRLESDGLIYPCFCSRAELHAASAPHASDGTPVYTGTCRNLTPAQIAEKSARRSPALRLRVPEPSSTQDMVMFCDRVYGEQCEMLSRDCGDFLVRRSDGVFAYQLAVVVDDAEIGVNEVVRGNDLLGSAARQIYLQELLGYPHPAYAHVPVLMAPDGHRLSKRNRDCDLGELKRRFGTAERLIGRLAFATGLSKKDEPASAEKLAEGFSWRALAQAQRTVVISDTFFE